MTDTAAAAAAGDPAAHPLAGTAGRFPVSFAVFTLARKHRALAAELLRELGLYAGQELMLMQLWENDGQSQNSLGRTLGLDHSTVAKSVRRLEDAGLVSRARSTRDRRSTVVSLTAAGRDLETAVTEVWARLEATAAADFTDQERGQFVSLAHRIGTNIDTASPGDEPGTA
ncbi:MarR family winged helix-turn-helix transcriptional regulator [Streptomyces sp. NPDC001595]|uniref:MarR family winged helix-turn-helix transcriptional regulator n=1 Tax=Streptomyces sp. NPDC001532 TaxID=3154520 RepID=UPI0033178C7A